MRISAPALPSLRRTDHSSSFDLPFGQEQFRNWRRGSRTESRDDMILLFDMFRNDFGTTDTDFEGDGIDDEYTLKLLDVARSRDHADELRIATLTAFDINRMNLEAETDFDSLAARGKSPHSVLGRLQGFGESDPDGCIHRDVGMPIVVAGDCRRPVIARIARCEAAANSLLPVFMVSRSLRSVPAPMAWRKMRLRLKAPTWMSSRLSMFSCSRRWVRRMAPVS